MKKVYLNAKKGDFAEPLLTGKALIFDEVLDHGYCSDFNNYEEHVWSFIVQEQFGKTLDD